MPLPWAVSSFTSVNHFPGASSQSGEFGDDQAITLLRDGKQLVYPAFFCGTAAGHFQFQPSIGLPSLSVAIGQDSMLLVPVALLVDGDPDIGDGL